MKIFVPFLLFLTLTSCSSCASTQKWPDTDDPEAQIAEHLLDSTVLVTVSGILSGYGSGVILYADEDKDLVITADHVCQPSSLFSVTTVKGQIFPALILYEDPLNDLCVLITSDLMEPVATMADALPPVGARIMHAGAPTGTFGRHLGVVVDGRYAGIEGHDGGYFVAMALPIAPGSSGGGVYYNNQLFSIVVMSAVPNSNISWGIELSHVKSAMIEAENKLSHLQ